MNQVYIVEAVSESGDEYLFGYKDMPTDQEVERTLRWNLGDEADHVTWHVTTLILEELT